MPLEWVLGHDIYTMIQWLKKIQEPKFNLELDLTTKNLFQQLFEDLTIKFHLDFDPIVRNKL